jgi:Zn-dependent M32 family carboxypeptidase
LDRTRFFSSRLLHSVASALYQLNGVAQLTPRSRGAYCSATQEVRKPPALAKLEACLSSEGYHAWVKAREAKDGAGDFALFAPALTKLVKLRRDIAAHCAPRGTATYDFCIDQYERGVSSARIRQVRLSALFSALWLMT